jgi:multicomponent Na+:H+ antiporter subunit G
VIHVIYILLGIGIIFQVLGVVALYRFPDVYTRLHGATKCTTFGSIFLYLGIILYGVKVGYVALPVHVFLVMMFLLATNPTGAHAIARAAHRGGVLPKKAVVDKLQEEGR